MASLALPAAPPRPRWVSQARQLLEGLRTPRETAMVEAALAEHPDLAALKVLRGLWDDRVRHGRPRGGAVCGRRNLHGLGAHGDTQWAARGAAAEGLRVTACAVRPSLTCMV